VSTNFLSYKAILIIGFGLLLTVLAITPGLAQNPSSQPPPPDIIPGEIVVKFQPNVGRLGVQNSLRAEGLSPLEVSPDTGAVRVQVEPGQEAQTIAELQARGDVVYATYNYEIKALRDPNDPLYTSQWSLKHFLDHDIDAPEAWDLYTGSGNIVIAVIDSGVDLNHPDLQAKIVGGYDYVNGDSSANDDFGHGTHVAGIAAASTNNGIGIAGVSWGAKIMPLKVLNAFGNGSTFDLAQAIKDAADNGAKVINMSLGGSCGSGWPNVETAVNYALSKGVVLVAASGNNSSTPVLCPAAINGVMAVGATNADDQRASYSTYGAALDVAAPGDAIYSTYPGGGYTTMSGTSMATPHVAGLAALLWSYAPALSNSQVRNIIEMSADDLIPSSPDACAVNNPGYIDKTGWDPCFGFGRINARRALERVALQIVPSRPFLLIGDNTPLVSSNVQVVTANPETISWSAIISPTVSWLTLSPPAAGAVSATSSNQFIQIKATNPSPGNYGLYTATLVLNGVTASGSAFGPSTTQVQLLYVPKVHTYYFPLMFKK
jgi:thermitase